MKSTVFVRPNLKMFFLGGIALVVIQHLIIDGSSQAQGFPKVLAANAREIGDDQFQNLVQRATETPSAELYLRLSHSYEKRGDYKRALHYLRRAEQVGLLDGGTE